MARVFYETVSDALVGFLPPTLRTFHARAGGSGLKVWYGEETAEHYECQMVPKAALSAGGIKPVTGPMLEIGFHAEHPDAARNDAALELLRSRERTWRKLLGTEPVAGPFVGRQRGWRRLSELWDGDGLETDEAAVEAAERLARYIAAFEPIRAQR